MEDKFLYLLCTILGALVTTFFGYWIGRDKTYNDEKGKNQAIAEDRDPIIKDLEEIKSQLTFLTQSKLSLKSEERNAITSCYERFSYWQSVLLSAKSDEITDKELDNKSKELVKIDEAYFNFCVAFSKMKIFIKNDELVQAFINITSKTRELEYTVKVYLVSHDHEKRLLLIQEENRSIIGFQPFRSEAQKKYIVDLKEFYDKKGTIIKEINERDNLVFLQFNFMY